MEGICSREPNEFPPLDPGCVATLNLPGAANGHSKTFTLWHAKSYPAKWFASAVLRHGISGGFWNGGWQEKGPALDYRAKAKFIVIRF
jgi:hypothetical protein